MSNFRLPPGNVSVQLPFASPTGPQTLYEQFLLIGIDLNRFALDELPVLSTEQLTQMASALGFSPNPFAGAQMLADGSGVPQSACDQAGVGVERELWTDLTAGAEFTYVKTDYLQRNRDLNLRVPCRARPTRRSGRSSPLHALWPRSARYRFASPRRAPNTAP